MAIIHPFKALRPVRDKVHLVATRPYYSYKKNVLKAKLQDNPYTFLRIINPEFHAKSKTQPNSPERFEQVKESYEKFKAEGVLIEDQQPHLYIYRQTKNGHPFIGVIAGTSVEEYEKDTIKKHEATLTSREEMFTTYLDIVGYNAEPVLMSYEGNEIIDQLLEKISSDRPEYEFTTTDKITHELWIVPAPYEQKLLKAFQEIEALYIADGHHRSASSVRLSENRKSRNETAYKNQDYILSFLIDEKRLEILEFNRLIKNCPLSLEKLLNALEQSFEISPLKSKCKPKKEHDIHLCFKGKWFCLTCKPTIIQQDHPVESLDAEILTQYILDPILHIQDLKTNSNIEFISGAESLTVFEQKITKQQFDLGFVLYPVRMDQVKKVADHQMIMPPKSTWVEPKMRSGLTIYNINE